MSCIAVGWAGGFAHLTHRRMSVNGGLKTRRGIVVCAHPIRLIECFFGKIKITDGAFHDLKNLPEITWVLFVSALIWLR